jgi:hypothetical protein
MRYREYDLERKTPMVGRQSAPTMDGKSVRNGAVTTNLAAAMKEAEKFAERVLAEMDTAASDAKP